MEATGRFRVHSPGLNLRSEPRVEPATRLAVLPRGHLVRARGDAADGWLPVLTELSGREALGFVALRFLVPDTEFERPPAHTTLGPVHLAEDHPEARRDVAGRRAFPIGEPDRPRRRPEGTEEEKRSDLAEILAWLDVEESPRYRATGTSTFCNIYAHDYAYLAGAYLPRVWWTRSAAARLAAGEPVRPEYGTTVSELNANSLFNWLVEFGLGLGWERVFSLEPLQDTADRGGVGLICAQRRELNRPGHIAAVVPESGDHRAVRHDGEIRRPLQSQAGRTNLRYSTLHWWTHSRFRDFGYWIHG